MNPSTASAAATSALRSMTGYAQARVERDGWLVRVSLRSVNHRFLDLRVRLPEGFEAFEPRIRQLLRDGLRRGHVEATVHFEAAIGPSTEINRVAAEAYLHAVESLRREFGFTQEPDLVALLRLPGVVASNGSAGAAAGAAGSTPGEEQIQRLDGLLVACVQDALSRLEQMCRAEGVSLSAEMRGLLAGIAETIVQAEAATERSRPAYAQRLKTRLTELLGDAGIDPARLAQEAALLAERADVTEELARLRSHVEQFATLVTTGGEAGKKLDFLLQEMQREANTFLSKTPGLGEDGLAITDLGLAMKSQIEKLREQAQNIE